MSIRPIGKRILITEEKAEEKRASGLIIPGNSEDKKVKYGKVMAVGKTIDEIAVDERVIYSARSGKDVEDRGQKYILLELDEVLAVVEGDKYD